MPKNPTIYSFQNDQLDTDITFLKNRVAELENRVVVNENVVADLDNRLDTVEETLNLVSPTSEPPVLESPTPVLESPTPEPPVVASPSASLIVDELGGPDTDLADHPDVIWYSTVPSVATDIVGHGQVKWGASWMDYAPQWAGPGDPGINNGNATIVAESSYGVNSIRFGSSFTPNNFVRDFAGGVAVYANSNPDGQTIQSWRKFFTPVGTGWVGWPSADAIGTTNYPECYVRFMIYFDADIETGMTYGAMKLGGFESGLSSGGSAPIFSYLKPVAGSGRVELTSYAGTFGVFRDYLSFTPKRYATFGQWHSLECYCKLNSSPTAADGILRMWHNDELIEDSTGSYYTTTQTNPLTVGQIRAQIFHGGFGNPGTQDVTPSASIHHKTFGFCAATRRIGMAKTV